MSKKDYGRMMRIPEDVWFALDTISKNNYRSIPQQLEKILREQTEIIRKGIVTIIRYILR